VGTATVELSYLPPFPGSKLVSAKLAPGLPFGYREGSESKDLLLAPVLDFQYKGPADLCPHEFKRSYVGAMAQAGWTILDSSPPEVCRPLYQSTCASNH
jgi:hypothetical protein